VSYGSLHKEFSEALERVNEGKPYSPDDDLPDVPGQRKKERKKKKGWKTSTAFSTTIPIEHTEQIMRELKIGGFYMSRDILRNGVEFRVQEYIPPAEQFQQHERRIELYRRLIDAAYRFGGMNERDKVKSPLGAIQADAKRSLFNMRLPGVIAETKKALANGEQVVISMISVSETTTESGNIFSAINGINTQKISKAGRHDFTDPTDIPEALIAQQELLEMFRALGPMESPVEILRREFGTDIGFITGKEKTSQRVDARKRFQANQISVIVITDAGKTGISLHDVTGRRRVHLIGADYDWSATMFKQELGRVDRTGQKSSPIITMMHMGTPGELKFLATITNRMRGLGATAKGGAESTGTTALNDLFEFGNTIDRQALQELWHRLSDNEKRVFLDSYFYNKAKGKAKDPDSWTPITNLPGTAEMVRKWTMALQSIPHETAKSLMEQFMEIRDSLSGMDELLRKYREERSTGELLRSTELASNLTLHEMRSKVGHKFGTLTGVLTPHMNRLEHIMGLNSPSQSEFIENAWRRWLNFVDEKTGQRFSGLEVKPSYIQRVSTEFGKQIAMNRTGGYCVTRLESRDKIPVRGRTWRSGSYT
jgi:hypothetical protein